MNPAVNSFRVVVRQVNLARPDALMKLPELGHGLTPIYRVARRTLQQENHGVEHVGDLLHEE